MPHAISSSCAYRIRPRHPGMGIQQTRACVTLSLGFLPPPGAPRAALSLRKYHWYRYLSSLAFGSNPKVIRERIVARRSPDNNGNVSAVMRPFYTDIQLKTLSRRIEVFNMKIIMRRESVIFYSENHRFDNAVRRCLSN